MNAITRAGLAGLSLLAACAGSPGENSPEPTAELRMMNAAVGAPPLDLVVDGQILVTGVRYERTSGLVTVPAGARSMVLRPTGQSSALSSSQVTLVSGTRYNLIASGTGAAVSLTTSVAVDTGLARPGRANIRIINIGSASLPTDSASLSAPIPLDVVITAPGVPLAGAPSQLSLDARFSSYSSLLYFDPATWTVRFVRPGTSDVAAETPAIVMGAGQVRAVTLQRRPDGTWTTSVVSEQ
jgi:hypothetical protein